MRIDNQINYLHYLIMSHIIRRIHSSAYQEINYYKRPSGWAMKTHMHNHFQILVILAGDLIAGLPGRKRICCAEGDLLFIPPPLLHSLSSPYGYEQLGINTNDAGTEDDRGLINLLDMITEPVVTPLPPRLMTEIREVSLSQQTSMMDRLRLLHLADSMVIHLLGKEEGNEAGHFRHSKMEVLIEDSLNRNLTLKEAAGALNLSIPHLERISKKQYGRGFIEEYLQRKADFSCRLLTDTHDSIEVVSEKLGFSSAAYFSRFFSKRVGMAPSVYRRRFD